MEQKSEYMVFMGDNKQLEKVLLTEAPRGWKPILMTSDVIGVSITLHLILERTVATKD